MSSAMNEQQIRDAMTQPDCPWPAVAGGIAALYRNNKTALADALVDDAESVLLPEKNLNALLPLYQVRAKAGSLPKGVASWTQKIAQVMSAEWEQKALIDQAGFDSGISAEEAFRRLLLLFALREGTVCYDKTWGTGVVGKIDYFYKRVDIDFRKKRGHQLALSYAAEKLLLLDEHHLLYWRHQKPAELAEKVKTQPLEIVKQAIRSFGPLSAVQLQEKLVPEIVEEAKWKSFWEAARKLSKTDKGIQIPAPRTEAIKLIEASESDDISHDLNGLAGERNLETLVKRFEELVEEVGQGGLTDQQRGILQDRLAFAVKGAWPRQLTVLARVKMAAVALGVDDEANPATAAVARFFDADIFLETLKKLPARHSALFLRYLAGHDRERLETMMLSRMSHMDIGSMSEVINYLLENAQEKKAADIFRAAIDSRNPGIEILSWLSRSMEKVAAWNLGPMNQILNFMVDEIEKDYSGDQLKAQNQLKERFGKSDWMKSAMAQLDETQRANLTLRVKQSTGWSMLDRQSQLAVMVKLYPELETLIAMSTKEEAVKPKGPLTSIRSYEERKEQLQRIVNFEIPKVAKEIALAREYGDLRENFEYKAAKDAQALLFRRRDEMAAQLAKVTPTDFKDMPTDKVGPATAVELTYGDGKSETFYLLGEWDSDPTLGIISSNSRMAQVLTGRVAGEHLMVPTEHGDATCTIASVNPLPLNIRQWILRK